MTVSRRFSLVQALGIASAVVGLFGSRCSRGPTKTTYNGERCPQSRPDAIEEQDPTLPTSSGTRGSPMPGTMPARRLGRRGGSEEEDTALAGTTAPERPAPTRWRAAPARVAEADLSAAWQPKSAASARGLMRGRARRVRRRCGDQLGRGLLPRSDGQEGHLRPGRGVHRQSEDHLLPDQHRLPDRPDLSPHRQMVSEHGACQ